VNLRFLPNALTVFRLLAVIPLVFLLVTGHFKEALILAFAAGISDLVDGYLARRFGWITHWGGVFDPLADKLLLVSSTFTLAYLGHLPWWLIGLIVVRDLIIVGGGFYYHYRIAPVKAAPTWLSKYNTLFLIVLVVVVLFRLSGFAVYPWIETALVWAVTLTTIGSGIHYVWIWSIKARNAKTAD